MTTVRVVRRARRAAGDPRVAARVSGKATWLPLPEAGDAIA
jgi:hypothetical protein